MPQLQVSKSTLRLKFLIVSTFSSLFQYVAFIYKIVRCVLIMRKDETCALFCFVLGIGTFNSLVEDVAVYLGSRETEETAEVFEMEISDVELEDDVPIMVNNDSIDDCILALVATEITVDDAILLTSLPTSASSDEDANITEMSLSSNVFSAPEASADDTAVAVVSEVVFTYEKADQKEAEMGSSTGYDVEVEGSELIDAVDAESLPSFGSSATLCDDALSAMVDLAPGSSIEEGAYAAESQPDGTLQLTETFESTDNLKNSDVEDKDAELVNIDNLLGETSSAVLSDDALSAAGDSSSGSSSEEGTHAANSGLGTSELMVILESTESLKDSSEIGSMESVISDSIDSEVSATSLESSVNEERKVVDLEDASTLPAFPSPENVIVMDSALCDADSSTSTSDTCVDSFSSLENAAPTLPSEPSATLVPAEMQSTLSSTADEVPEVAKKEVAWVKRPANRRGGGGPARKRAREQRVAIFKEMPFWDDADDASPASTPDNVAPSSSSASTSDIVASSEPSTSPRISSAPISDNIAPSEPSMPARVSSASTPDDASSESSASTAKSSLADAATGRERRVSDVTDVVATMFSARAPCGMTVDLLEAEPQVIVGVMRTATVMTVEAKVLRTTTDAARITTMVNVETTARPAVIAATMTATSAKML
ncbi:hypothetical protein DFH11DRAFT_258633 [Phellopilus nigrolimitatus]|nr:hypothetical protein DFH11DRAFT_258633 [Phellopilus nigrolimitatus]